MCKGVIRQTELKLQLETDLIGVVKQLQDGEYAGSNEQAHLTPNITCRRHTVCARSHKKKTNNWRKQTKESIASTFS